ncbi:MAG: imidazole glycerol phosphate synthase subunit HisH [Clostridia bacterium]|nr:imidazole glycerol phosphate synthase subunit HisH [Clostridia bacterium]
MRVVIADYGMGNLRSVQQAVQALGCDAVISGNPETVARADRLILPGVGAFGDAVARLHRLGLDTAVTAAAAGGTPLLGICLGMQLLLEESLEFGHFEGLGLIPGRVVPFSRPKTQGLRIPHIGWNSIGAAPDSFVDNLPDSYMYFVHSYHADCVPPAFAAASCTYGYPFVCALQRDHIWGTQFHPEKSGRAGLLVLEHFLTQPVDKRGGGVDNYDHLSGS